MISMFAKSKSVFIIVNPIKEQAFWLNVLSYYAYGEYTIYMLLEALDMISFNTYVRFNEKYSNKYTGRKYISTYLRIYCRSICIMV